MKRATEKLHDEQRLIVAYLDGLQTKGLECDPCTGINVSFEKSAVFWKGFLQANGVEKEQFHFEVDKISL